MNAERLQSIIEFLSALPPKADMWMSALGHKRTSMLADSGTVRIIPSVKQIACFLGFHSNSAKNLEFAACWLPHKVLCPRS
jgi:hypothetical protein